MRIAYKNIIDDIEPTAITPLTVNTNYPVSNIQDQRLSIKYKSDAATTQSILVELPTYPLIPDNVAGTTYRSNFATTDGWASSNNTLSVSGGVLTLNKTSTTGYNGLMDKTLAVSAKSYYIKITPLQTLVSLELRALLSSVSTTLYTASAPAIGVPIYISVYNAGTFDTVRLIGVVSTTAQVGNLFSVDFVYIGTGAYDAQALDRAGNGNNLINTACTPVNGKYGKEFLFNGTTSFLQASSPVIGKTGTVAVRFKLNATTAIQDIAANTSADTFKGFRLRSAIGGDLNAFIGGESSFQNVSLGTIGTTLYNTVILSWDGTTITKTIAGVTTTEAQTTAMSSALLNLTIGRIAYSSLSFLNGIISHFLCDSAIFSAEEARAWSLNPNSYQVRNSTVAYINLDSEYAVNTAAILGHNIKTTNIKIEASETSDFTSPELSETLSWNKDTILKFFSESYIYKYWKFSFAKQGSIEIGRLWLSEYITIDPSSLLNFKVGRERSDIVTYGRGRQKFSDVGVGWRTFSFAFPKTAYSMIRKIEKMLETVGLHSSFIFCNFDDIRDYEIVEPCYCSFNKTITFNHSKNMKFDYTVELEEDL